MQLSYLRQNVQCHLERRRNGNPEPPLFRHIDVVQDRAELGKNSNRGLRSKSRLICTRNDTKTRIEKMESEVLDMKHLFEVKQKKLEDELTELRDMISNADIQ